MVFVHGSRALNIKALSLSRIAGNLTLCIIIITKVFPAIIILLSLLFALVGNDALVAGVDGAEDEGSHGCTGSSVVTRANLLVFGNRL